MKQKWLKVLGIEAKRSCRSVENVMVEVEDDEMITRCCSQLENVVPYILHLDRAAPLTLGLL
jgi:hypothetical protein